MKTRPISSKALIIWILFFVTANHAIAQNTSPNNIKTVNQHLLFVNKITEELNKSQKCLLSLYSRLEPGRTPRGFFHIGDQYSCARFIDEKQFNTLLNQTKSQNSNIAIEINSQTQKLYDIYLEINKLSRELEIYVRLEDYKKDRLKHSDEIYHQLKIKYDEYQTEIGNFHQWITNNFESGTKNNVSPKQTAYQNMREYLLSEEKFFSNLKMNFCSRIFTASLPIDLILKQLTESDNYLAELKVPQSTEFRKYRSFVSTALGRIQKTKREAIDEYSIDAQKSDNYTNSFIDNYQIYLNYYLINDFNDFVKENQSGMLYFPITIATFKLDSTLREYIQPIVKYTASDIPELIVNEKSAEIQPETAYALNNYIEFINEELRINSSFATKLYYLNNTANKQLKTNSNDLYLSFSYYDKYALPTAAYEKTLNESRHINEQERKILNLLLTELYRVIAEKYQLTIDLEKYVDKKTYRADKFDFLYHSLQRFEYLLDMFDSRKQLLYEYTRKIYQSYPAKNHGPWQKGGEEMLSQIDTDFVAYKQVKYDLKNQKYDKVATSGIEAVSRNLLLNEYEYLKGLRKLGRNHGLCPYNPYEDIAKGSSDYAEFLAQFPNQTRIERDMPNYFREFNYKYNDLVDDYNKFVDLAQGGYETFAYHNVKEFYLLKTVKQAVFYQFTKPEKIETGQSEQNQNDSTSISMDGYANNNLVLLLDVSGSMRAEDKLPLLRASFLKILPHLRDKDEISIVVFSGKGKVLLNSVSCSKKKKITEVLESLESKGQSNFNNGLKLAYKTAKSNFKPNANNRIILATDGAFSIEDELYQLAENESDNKTYLSVFSFGNKNNKVRSLDKLAKTGKGNYEYIETENAVQKLLKELQAIKIN